ncbi:hypothetical protein OPIT5_27300 [Opitutaceae bacterium TAV5]|nr:hypothetical protein OPIT5_27300 [Opitutaceae bacterium TAV5]
MVGGFPIYQEAWENLRKWRMTMELSMTIALLAALCIGQFFTALVIAFFVLFAELVEGYTVGGGRRAIQKLTDSLPHRVTVRRNGQEQELGTHEVERGEIVIIRPGERIPADGEVSKGNSFVDQASITGESLPVEKVQTSTITVIIVAGACGVALPGPRRRAAGLVNRVFPQRQPVREPLTAFR